MPLPHLPAFEIFEASDFHLGGDPGVIEGVAYDWLDFGGQCEATSGSMQGLDTASFIGSEGDKFSDLTHSVLPGQVRVMGQTHTAVGQTIRSYGDLLSMSQETMDGIIARARGTHKAVNNAATRYNNAEIAVAAATAAGGAALAAAEAEKAAALNEYFLQQALWEHDLNDAELVKYELGLDVSKLTDVILEQARLAFEPNPTGVEGADAAEEKIDEMEESDWTWLDDLAMLALTAGIVLPMRKVVDVAADIFTESRGIDYLSLLDSRNNNQWSDFETRLNEVLTPEQMEKLRSQREAIFSYMPQTTSDITSRLSDDEIAALSRGERVTEIAEPVDAATGALVETVEDIFVGGMLPLVVSRRYCSLFSYIGVGGVFGSGWMSSLDCHLEIFDDRVVMLAPDGAVVRFDAPSADGREVRASGREWLLSFVGGAYRVRDASSGIVYVFTIGSPISQHKPDGPVSDVDFGVPSAKGETSQQNWVEYGVRPMGFGRGSSTVAAALGKGVTIGLSLIVHRSGMWIEYVRDHVMGNITKLVRSDRTTVEVAWDHQLHRVTKLTVVDQVRQKGSVANAVKDEASLGESGSDNDQEYSDYGDVGQDQTEVFGKSQGQDSCRGGIVCVGFDYDQLGLLHKVFTPSSAQVQLTYEYDERSLLCGWVDSNSAGYWHVYDEVGRVIAQVGSGGVYANAFVWLDDSASDAPIGGQVCVMIETATAVEEDMLLEGREVVAERLKRLQELPLVQALRAGGLQKAGLTGGGRDGARDQHSDGADVDLPTNDNISAEWLFDEILGDIRASVWRSTADGDVWRVVSSLGVATDYIYNDCHQVIAIVGGDDGVVECIRNEDGQIVETLYPDGSGVRVETGVWGQPVKVTNTAGLSVEYELDAAGNIVSITDATGQITRVEYRWLVSGVVPWKVISPEGQVKIFECDAAGRVLATEDEQGMRWSVTRDAVGRVVEAMNPVGEVTRVRYSSQGRPTEVVLPDGCSQLAEYDGEGNQVRFVNETGAVTETKYTVFDKPLEITDAAGGVTRIVYNTQLEVVGVINADGHRWDYQYDLDGRLIMESDYNGLVTRYEHDQARNITRMVDPAGGVNTVYSDKAGRTTLMVDSLGRETTYSYAKQGWLDSISNSEATISYLRDEFGRLESEHTELATGETITASTERDLTGRMTAMVMNVAGHITCQQYNYHDVTRELTGINIFHNTLGSMSSAVTSSSASYVTMPSVASGLGFVGSVDLGVDELGRRNRFGIGVVDRMLEFDIRGRITADITAAIDPKGIDGFTVVAGRQFTWRVDDALIGINDALAGNSVFDVDMMGRVRSIQHDRTTIIQTHPDRSSLGVTGGGLPRSPLNNSSGGRDVFATERYSYSAAGQLQHGVSPDYIQHDGVLPRSRADVESGDEAVFNYDRVMKNTLVTQVGKTSYVYDDLGRIIRSVTKRLSRKPLVQHYQYAGSSGHVKTFSSSDHPHRVWEYTYDGVGRRVAKTCRDTRSDTLVIKVVFGYYGDRMATEHYLYGNDEKGTIARAWITDPKTGSTIAQLSTSYSASDKNHSAPNSVADQQQEKPHWAQQTTTKLHALVTDLAGAPKEIINTVTGNVIGRSIQTLYGQRNWKGNATCPLLFTGQYHDNETNLVYNRYRYYDPVAGIYTSQDPLGQTPNLASPQNYTKNPTTWTDPLGLNQCKNTFKQDEFGAWNDTGKNARILRKGMINDAEMTPKPGDDAHHIVPARLKRGRAEDLRKKFKSFDIDINDPINGEFLPGSNATVDKGDNRLRHHGSGVHSTAEIDAIYEYVESSATAEEFKGRMNNVKQFHREGITMAKVEELADARDVSMDAMTYESYLAFMEQK